MLRVWSRWRTSVDQSARYTDVNYMNFAQPRLGCWVREAFLRRYKRRRMLSPDGRSEWLAGIAVQTGGDIDRQNSCGSAVDGGDDRIEWWPHSARQTRTEERIDDPLRVRKLAAELFAIQWLKLHLLNGQTGLDDNVVIDGCVAGQVLRFSEQEDLDCDPRIVQVPRNHKTVAAVVP